MSEQGTDSAAPQRGGRYQRGFDGLIGAMIITLVVIIGFVAFRAVTRDNPDMTPKPIEYVGLVADQQAAGRTVVHPRSLPEGWVVTSATYDAGTRPGWSLGLHTEDGKYAGIRQQEEYLPELLDIFVDEDATEGEPLSVRGSVAETWQSFSDEGGDHAFAAELGDDTVLVYGSASEADLKTLVGLLSIDPVR